MLNRSVLVGRLTKDPELRYTNNGVAVANFTIAVNRPFKNQDGEQEADFINCVIWRKPAENLASYMSKGSMVGVDGRIQTRSYDNQEGKRIFITEVVAESVQFLETKQSNQNQGNNNPQQPKQSTQSQNESSKQSLEEAGEPVDLQDDDLPF
ncbi:single-stranded DNA-binding protein [Alkalibacillus almallahensis]|uniref:single-stranded DNA-binding protein n=1 Tax=Alkalibacillus almallahensis TaxID=1379154 RepID=UPI00141E2304|nr:single-stranded DNA-binding protein [Alkalibacillus almallahensis]NIK12853.1 single-strand DNA-binding protein [Alkalibacillus almallahensis]